MQMKKNGQVSLGLIHPSKYLYQKHTRSGNVSKTKVDWSDYQWNVIFSKSRPFKRFVSPPVSLFWRNLILLMLHFSKLLFLKSLRVVFSSPLISSPKQSWAERILKNVKLFVIKLFLLRIHLV